MMKFGKVKTVSKTGGIILEGHKVWYNPVDEATAQYASPQLKDQNVELSLTLIDGFLKYKEIKVVDNPSSDEVFHPSDRRELLIIRQSCLKAAVALIVTEQRQVSLEDITRIAEQFEGWVLR